MKILGLTKTKSDATSLNNNKLRQLKPFLGVNNLANHQNAVSSPIPQSLSGASPAAADGQPALKKRRLTQTSLQQPQQVIQGVITEPFDDGNHDVQILSVPMTYYSYPFRITFNLKCSVFELI